MVAGGEAFQPEAAEQSTLAGKPVVGQKCEMVNDEMQTMRRRSMLEAGSSAENWSRWQQLTDH